MPKGFFEKEIWVGEGPDRRRHLVATERQKNTLKKPFSGSSMGPLNLLQAFYATFQHPRVH